MGTNWFYFFAVSASAGFCIFQNTKSDWMGWFVYAVLIALGLMCDAVCNAIAESKK